MQEERPPLYPPDKSFSQSRIYQAPPHCRWQPIGTIRCEMQIHVRANLERKAKLFQVEGCTHGGVNDISNAFFHIEIAEK